MKISKKNIRAKINGMTLIFHRKRKSKMEAQALEERCDRIETKILKGSVYLQIASIFEPEGINGTYFMSLNRNISSQFSRLLRSTQTIWPFIKSSDFYA